MLEKEKKLALVSEEVFALKISDGWVVAGEITSNGQTLSEHHTVMIGV